jgi:hypothetical protein
MRTRAMEPKLAAWKARTIGARSSAIVSQLKGPQAATEAAPIRNVPELPGVDTDSERRNLMADIAYGAVL